MVPATTPKAKMMAITSGREAENDPHTEKDQREYQVAESPFGRHFVFSPVRTPIGDRKTVENRREGRREFSMLATTDNLSLNKNSRSRQGEMQGEELSGRS